MIRSIAIAVVFMLVGGGAGAGVVRYFALSASNASNASSGVALRAAAPEATDAPKDESSRSFSIRHVRVVEPRRTAFSEEVDLAAVVSPRAVVPAHFLLSGKVEACRVKVGDVVEASAEVCRLDATLARLERDRAAAASRAAGRAVDAEFLARQKGLFESGVIGQGEWERLRVESEKASALRNDADSALAFAEKKLELHILRAPLSGRVVELRTRAGLPIAPEMAAAVIASSGPGVLKAEVPARHWARVQAGTLLRLTSVASVPLSDEEPVRYFQVASKAPSVSPEKQTFEVEFSPSGGFSADSGVEDLGLAPGMLVGGRLVLGEVPQAAVVPFAALTSWDSASRRGTLFALGRDGRVRKLAVRTSLPSDGDVHLLGAMPPDVRIVYPVPSSLREGDAVEVVP